jgi:hypothetical protein
MIYLSEKWAPQLTSQPETGMGYQVVTVGLNDGRQFPQAVVDSNYVTKVRGYAEVPFSEDEISSITVTHDKWDWAKG